MVIVFNCVYQLFMKKKKSLNGGLRFDSVQKAH